MATIFLHPVNLFIGGLGPWEIAIILVVVLLLFGGKKIPQLARDLGSGMREFRKNLGGASQEIEEFKSDLSMDGLDAQDPYYKNEPAPVVPKTEKSVASRKTVKKAGKKAAGKKTASGKTAVRKSPSKKTSKTGKKTKRS